MASFIGGEALARIVSISGRGIVGPTGGGFVTVTTYTVPANRYAVLLGTIDQIDGRIVINNSGVPFTNSAPDTITGLDGAGFPISVFDEGAQILIQARTGGFSQNTGYSYLIQEFNKPDSLTA